MTTTEQSGADIGDFEDSGVDIDALFDVLSNPRRRFVVTCLDKHSKPLAMADVATELTYWESDTPRNEITSEQVGTRYEALHHVHVPKMVDTGIIVHDKDRNTIGLTDHCTGIASITEPPLSVLPESRQVV